jgi:hypothetical protein
MSNETVDWWKEAKKKSKTFRNYAWVKGYAEEMRKIRGDGAIYPTGRIGLVSVWLAIACIEKRLRCASIDIEVFQQLLEDLMKRVKTLTRKSVLTHKQIEFLSLWGKGERNLTVLSKKLGVSKSRACHIRKRLKELGLIEDL